MMREIDARFYLLIFRRFTMGVLNIIFAIVLILTSVGVIALVSMQESKRGMSALTLPADSRRQLDATTAEPEMRCWSKEQKS